MIPRILGARILVKRIDSPTPKSEFLEVVSLDNEPSQFAKVVSVGNGEQLKDGTRRTIEVEVGDTIVTKLYCGTPVTVNLLGGTNENYHIVVEDDVLAILVDD